MADLELVLSWLGLSQYHDRFVQAGFDSWETVLEITEDDLEILNVDRGHRRKLQREIARSKTPMLDPVVPLAQSLMQNQSGSNTYNPPTVNQEKRTYRHHPKPDLNAPERPYSAYVLFSNKMRENPGMQSLSFTAISRHVGESWQSLTPEEKAGWKQQASIPLEKYKADLEKYQKSESYKEYQRYLVDFKSAQPAKKANVKVSQPPLTASPATPLSSTFPSAAPLYSQAHIKPDEPKRAISRIARPPDVGNPTPEGPRTQRINQACESCRRRRIKCPGEQPACSRCQNYNVACVYADKKKDDEKRTVENLWNKVIAYETILSRVMHQVDDEDQTAIQESLLLPPQLENIGEHSITLNRTSRDHGGESDASGVGSMGSTAHANEDDFAQAGFQGSSKAFVGQSSGEKWVQRLESELSPPLEEDRQPGLRPKRDKAPNFQNNPHPRDMDTSVIGHQIDPYEIPLRSTADALVNAYFTSCHPSFPMVIEADFWSQYGHYYAAAEPETFSDRIFLATLQVILAISAVHAHMISAEWIGDDRDHLLYFARARVLSVEMGVLNDSVFHGQVQMFGLSAMYFMVTDQFNRAWNTLGLAIRCAQALGMHLQNVTPKLTDIEIDFRARIWYSIISLERVMTGVTGRPSMVREKDCSIPLPSLNYQDPLLAAARNQDQFQDMPSMDRRTGALTSASIAPESKDTINRPRLLIDAPVSIIYFRYFVELNALAQEVLLRLYNPEIRTLKWPKIQKIIHELDNKLVQWGSTLPRVLDSRVQSLDARNEPYQNAIGIFFSSVRMVINRPCLCRLDRKISNLSDKSAEASRESAAKCVHLARAVLTYLSGEPDLRKNDSGPLWWMLHHHLKRAITILLLELAYRSAHMPSEWEEILVDAKKGLKWLHALAIYSVAAKNSCITLSRLLLLAAQKVGGDTSDIIADFDQAQAPLSSQYDIPAADMFYPTYDTAAAGTYNPFNYPDSDFPNQGHFLGDLDMTGLDQYGFLTQPGFSSASQEGDEAVNMSGQQDDDTAPSYGF